MCMRDTVSKHQSINGTQGEVECSVLGIQNLLNSRIYKMQRFKVVLREGYFVANFGVTTPQLTWPSVAS